MNIDRKPPDDPVSIRAGYRHQIDNLCGHMLGTLDGRLMRLLETALVAATMDPPRTEVIVERIEDSIAIIRAEINELHTRIAKNRTISH